MSNFMKILKCIINACWRRAGGALEANGTGRAYLLTYGPVSLPDSFTGSR